ncbi:MAG: PKD domain-containing protein, partial [Bacteroidota bacterium]
MDSCNYRIYHSTYYDCTGGAFTFFTPVSVNASQNPPNAPGAPSINFTGIGTNCVGPTAIGNWTLVSFEEVTPICPTTQTGCEDPNSPINGVAGVTYYRDYSFCNTNCNEYRITDDLCCRNGAITSLTNPTSNSIYTGSTIINPNLNPCSSSPQFANPPVPYLCEGQTFTFNQGAFDPDGDSLSYELGDCFDGANQPVSYAPGFSATAPLGPNIDVDIDSITGDITITPQPGSGVQVGVLCVVVKEYRNGVLIGTVVRDIQITIIPANLCAQNTAPVITSLANLSPGATANGLVISACTCGELSFDIPVIDPDSNQNFILTWNGNIAGGEFTDALNPFQPTDTVTSFNITPTGQFTWAPTVPGLYTFLVSIQDDGCPIIGQNQYTIVIDVDGCNQDAFAAVNKTDCFDFEFSGVACIGIAPFTYSWAGAGGLSGIGQTINHTYAGPGSYPYTLTVVDSVGANYFFQGIVDVVNTAIVDGGPDLTLCPSETATIGTPGLPGYTYQWTSPAGVGWVGTPNPTTPQADVALNNGTNNVICIPYVLEASDPLGCVSYDTVTVCYTPKPPSTFAITNTVCAGSPATATYSAPQVPGANYTWTYGGGGQGTSTGPGPHNITWSTPGTYEVKLQVEVNGCLSDVTTNLVKVNPIPTANFAITQQVCAGQAALINYNGSGDPTSASFIWDFDGGSGIGGSGPFTVSWNTPGMKTVTLTVVENGCISPVFSQTVEVFPVPTSDFNLPPQVCVDGGVQIVYTGTASGAAAYAWTFNTTNVTGSGAGPYSASWSLPGPQNVTLQVEENGCISSATTKVINVLPDPVAGIAPVQNICFSGNSINFNYTGDSNVDNYFWNFGSDALPAQSQAASPPAVTYQNPGVKTVSLVVIRDGCISDSVFVTFEVVPEPSANFNANNGGICSDDCITYTYTG